MKQFIGAIIGIIVIWFFSSNKGTEQNVTKQIEDHKNKVKEGQEAIREEMRQKEVEFNQAAKPLLEEGFNMEIESKKIFGFLEEKNKMEAAARSDRRDKEVDYILEKLKTWSYEKLREINEETMCKVYRQTYCYDKMIDEKEQLKMSIISKIKLANELLPEINSLQAKKELNLFDKESLRQKLAFYQKVQVMDRDISDEGLERQIKNNPSQGLKKCLVRADKVIPILVKYGVSYCYYDRYKRRNEGVTISQEMAKLQEVFGIAKDIDFTIKLLLSKISNKREEFYKESRITSQDSRSEKFYVQNAAYLEYHNDLIFNLKEVSPENEAYLRYYRDLIDTEIKKLSPDNKGFSYNGYKNYRGNLDNLYISRPGADIGNQHQVYDISKALLARVKVIDGETISFETEERKVCDYPYPNYKITHKQDCITISANNTCFYQKGHEPLCKEFPARNICDNVYTVYEGKRDIYGEFWGGKDISHKFYLEDRPKMYKANKKKVCKMVRDNIKFKIYGIEAAAKGSKQLALDQTGKIEKVSLSQKGKEFLEQKIANSYGGMKCKVWHKKEDSSKKQGICNVYTKVVGTGDNYRVDVDYLHIEYIKAGLVKAKDNLYSYIEKVTKERVEQDTSKCLKDGVCNDAKASIWQDGVISKHMEVDTQKNDGA